MVNSARPFFSLSVLSLALAAWPFTACKKSIPPRAAATQPAASLQPTQVRALTADEQSCKTFVQNFYDWYWNRFADRAQEPNFDYSQTPGLDDVFRRNPPVLTRQLIDVVKRYERAADAPHPGDEGRGGSVLEYWDPIINDQGPSGKYLVTQVHFSNDRCLARVQGSESVVQPELKRFGSGWTFDNFYYPDAEGKSKSNWIDEFSN
jgi:hypothetical protein